MARAVNPYGDGKASQRIVGGCSMALGSPRKTGGIYGMKNPEPDTPEEYPWPIS